MRAGRNRASLGVATLIALVGAGLVVAPAAGQVASDCPVPVPVSQITDGMIATGRTVSRGRTPESFTVEILGVLTDALGAGRDMIVGDASSPAIDAAGGIWAGMSGSPVYHSDGRLIGAVAYGLSEGPSSIAGITPAEDLLRILTYPHKEPSDNVGSPDGGGYVELTRSMQRAIGATGQSSGDGRLTALRVPLSVSGGRAANYISAGIEREKLPYIAYAGSSATTGEQVAAAEAPEPGDSFAAAFSYGDITVAEVGTAAVVCQGMVVSFGHSVYPFFPQGYVEMGANAAKVVTIVSNPNFKLATIEEPLGTVDQDRLAGIRALLDMAPSVVPIRSTISVPDLNSTLQGATDVVVQRMVPTIGQVHYVDSIDSVFDQVGAGSAAASWTIRGTRESGAEWTLNRSNIYASQDDIARASSGELTGNLFALFFSGFEKIEFTSVDVQATVDEELEAYTIVGVLTSVNGGEFKQRSRIRVKGGEKLTLRVMLRPPGGSEDGSNDVPTDMQLRVPKRMKQPGYIQVQGGRTSNFRSCFYDGEYCARQIQRKVDSFDELLDRLANRPQNNSMIARLRVGRKIRSRSIVTLDRIALGSYFISLRTGRRDLQSGPR